MRLPDLGEGTWGSHQTVSRVLWARVSAHLVGPGPLDLLNRVTHAEVAVMNRVTEILHCRMHGNVI